MDEQLRQHETIIKVTEQEAEEIKELLLRKQSLAEMIDHLIYKNQQTIKQQTDFWDRIKHKYLVADNIKIYIDFATRELRRG